MDFSNKFKTIKKTVLFTGDKMEIFLPERYSRKGLLEQAEMITTLGIFDCIIDGKKQGYFLPARITIAPTEKATISVDGEKFVKLTLRTNDIFILNNEIIQEESLAYSIFNEIIYAGRTPKFLDYVDKAFIFDTVSEVTGISFPTDHVVFEIMVAALHRDKNDISLQYRLTDMKEDPKSIPLNMVAHAALSTTSKIVGAYMDDGIDASLVNPSTINSDIEDLLQE